MGLNLFTIPKCRNDVKTTLSLNLFEKMGMKCQKYGILGFFKEGLSQILLVSFLNSLFHIRIIFIRKFFWVGPSHQMGQSIQEWTK